MTNLVFANRVKLLRKSNNYTQKQLAKKIGVSQGWISLIESKGLVPSYPILYILADALHTTTGYLLPENTKDPKAREIAVLKAQVEDKRKEIEQLEARITDLEKPLKEE